MTTEGLFTRLADHISDGPASGGPPTCAECGQAGWQIVIIPGRDYPDFTIEAAAVCKGCGFTKLFSLLPKQKRETP